MDIHTLIYQTDTDLLRYVADNAGTFFLLIVAVFGAYREWWVPGPTHRKQIAEERGRTDKCEESAREWKNMALSGMEQAERGLGVAEKLTRGRERGT